MRPDTRFLLLCGAVAGASLATVILPVPAMLRTVFALPLVFVLPGAALLRALQLRFAPCAHAPIVVGISMALTVLSGLVLDVLHGLTPFGWSAWLSGITLLAAFVARANGETSGRWRPALRIRHGVMLAATTAILALTVQTTLRDTAAYHPFPHTSFWMLSPVAASNVYMIGIKNDEGRPETYAVQLMVDQRITGEWQGLTLAPGQTITYPVMVQAGAPAQAWLYRTEHPDTIYRRVTVAGNNGTGGAAVVAVADAAGGGS